MIAQRFRYLGLVAVALEYAGTAYFVLVARQPLSLARPVSDYGTLGSTHLVFSVVYSVASVLYGAFGWWLAQWAHLHRKFSYSYIAGVVAFAVLAWLPDAGNAVTPLLHGTLAVIVIVVMPMIVYYYWLEAKKRLVRGVVATLIWIQVGAIGLYPLVVYLKMPLLPEVIATVAFQAWVVLATFETKALTGPLADRL